MRTNINANMSNWINVVDLATYPQKHGGLLPTYLYIL